MRYMKDDGFARSGTRIARSAKDNGRDYHLHHDVLSLLP